MGRQVKSLIQNDVQQMSGRFQPGNFQCVVLGFQSFDGSLASQAPQSYFFDVEKTDLFLVVHTKQKSLVNPGIQQKIQLYSIHFYGNENQIINQFERDFHFVHI